MEQLAISLGLLGITVTAAILWMRRADARRRDTEKEAA